jgi:hypothetical protein
MKRISFVCNLLSISLLVLLLGSCRKDGPKIIKQKVTGHVQKGPYINGTSISMSELNSSLEQTGKIFTTQISNNSGFFEINNVSLTSSYVEFSANGYYYNEVIDNISIAPLNLYALSDIADISTVNVNILTHLEKLRVEYLVKQNKTLSEAKKIAQGEILAIFGFSLSEMNNSETLDISVNNEGNAILLAISIILQGNRSVGDLTELLANISNDISEDGILNSESIIADLRNSTLELDLTSIRSSLENRYQELDINASIPDFEKYIIDFFIFTGVAQKPATTTQPVTNITATSVNLNGVVNANYFSTIVTFEYGTSTSYGNSATAAQSPVTGISSVNVSADITGLSRGTTYYIRIYATNSLGTAYGNEISFRTPTVNIGENYQGGIVAYFLQPGDLGYDANVQHGLIASPSDQGKSIVWWNGSYITTGATGKAIGTGDANTNTIVAAQGAGSYAAKLCYDLVLGGYGDWYLPSKDELNKLYINRAAIGGFYSGYHNSYWSSSEENSENAWYQVWLNEGLGEGFQFYFWKKEGYDFSVRAVRAF